MDQDYPNFRRAQRGAMRGQRRRRPKRKPESFLVTVLWLSAVVGVLTWQATPQIQSVITLASSSSEEIAARERSVYYSGCDDARASGAAPIYRGQPGYREGMDGDLDGIACEPYRR